MANGDKVIKSNSKNNSKSNLKGTLILLITSMIWGASFVSQRAGADVIGVNTFNALRMFLGSVVLLPVCLISVSRDKRRTNKTSASVKDGNDNSLKNLLKICAICGVLLCAASTVQTYGIKYTTPGKSGFITAMYIIFVPILSLITGNRVSKKTVISAAVAMIGMYMLSIKGGSGGINKGDVMTLGCAVLFALHIMVVDRYVADINPIYFSCIQFFVCGIINLILTIIFETVTFEMVKAAAVPVLYSGILSCGVAYTLQPIGQRYAEPSAAAVVMSFESVFAMLFGALLLPDNMPNMIEVFGCIIMFAAIILNQIDFKAIKIKGLKSLKQSKN